MNYPLIGLCPKCGEKDCLIEIDECDIAIGVDDGRRYKFVECPECREEFDVGMDFSDRIKHRIIDGDRLYRFQCTKCNEIFWLT